MPKVLDKYIRASGSSEGGNYFLGGRYSFAETATTPFLRRSLVTLPHFKKVDPRQIIKDKGLDRIGAWIQVLPHACRLAHMQGSEEALLIRLSSCSELRRRAEIVL